MLNFFFLINKRKIIKKNFYEGEEGREKYWKAWGKYRKINFFPLVISLELKHIKNNCIWDCKIQGEKT